MQITTNSFRTYNTRPAFSMQRNEQLSIPGMLTNIRGEYLDLRPSDTTGAIGVYGVSDDPDSFTDEFKRDEQIGNYYPQPKSVDQAMETFNTIALSKKPPSCLPGLINMVTKTPLIVEPVALAAVAAVVPFALTKRLIDVDVAQGQVSAAMTEYANTMPDHIRAALPKNVKGTHHQVNRFLGTFNRGT